ncbi:hypothetical protein LZF95_23195 [Algoriphagus sp. AGSA1]|nr:MULTISPECIES: JAB domain-containing protein [unclassified Algoriphagus]MCE7057607.1 hypothetical protein [Algoriphagus sp. AGSA1]
MPSRQDKRLTAKLVKIGRAMDLLVLDHLILTED